MSSRGRVYHPQPQLAKGEIRVTRVKQEFKREVNINEIIARMKKGIQPPSWMTSATPYYGDFSNMPVSLMDAYDIMQKAEEAFHSLPLEFRRELDHDPRNLSNAPRELFERFNLLKPKVADGTLGLPEGTAATPAPNNAEPSANEPVGSNKKPK